MKVVDDKFGEIYAKFDNIEGKKLDLNMLHYLKMNLGADQQHLLVNLFMGCQLLWRARETCINKPSQTGQFDQQIRNN